MRFRRLNKRKAWPLCQAFLLLSLGASAACSSVDNRIKNAKAELGAHNYIAQTIKTPSFLLFLAKPPALPDRNESIRLVIEGDGYAWVSRKKPSDNPTPIDPIGLKIAVESGALYLGRPCQYVIDSRCRVADWTTQRFGAATIAAYQNALDQIKKQYKNQFFDLTGYSGGAYITLVLAATRTDIQSVTTVAGLLDPQDWTTYHKITALEFAYDQEYLQKQTANVKFTHMCGLDDDVIPCSLTEEFVREATRQGFLNHKTLKLKEFGHHDFGRKSLGF